MCTWEWIKAYNLANVRRIRGVCEWKCYGGIRAEKRSKVWKSTPVPYKRGI